MAYTRTWNPAYEALPADANNVSEGATKIRNFKVDIRERMEKDHYFDANGTDADHGEHKWVTLRRQANAPANTANKGFVYTKASNGVSELFYKSDANIETQITAAGGVYSPANKILYGDDQVDVEDGAINFRIGNTNQVQIIDGVIRPVTNNDIDLGSNDYRVKDIHANGYLYITGRKQGLDVTAAIHRKILNIGAWNMDAISSVNVAHGLTLSKIRSASVMVTNDEGTAHYPIFTYSGVTDIAPDGEFYIGSDYVTISRRSSGGFDNAEFDYPSGNRGWIIIEYVD